MVFFLNWQSLKKDGWGQGRTRGPRSPAVVFLPPWEFQKYRIKRKLRLESNTWLWQRLRICLNSLLLQGEKSFSLLKRILHYTRCTMTESRLNDLALDFMMLLWLAVMELSNEGIEFLPQTQIFLSLYLCNPMS